MIFYDRCDVDSRRVEDFVRSGKTDDIGRSALPIYRENHTWKNRAQAVAEAMNAVWPDAHAALGTIFS